jgi:hypothetical protein
MATLWHALDLKRDAGRIFGEVHRVLKIQGRLAALSFKKEDRPWGPPLAQRPSPEQIAAAVTPHGFRRNLLVDLGDNFLLIFDRVRQPADRPPRRRKETQWNTSIRPVPCARARTWTRSASALI